MPNLTLPPNLESLNEKIETLQRNSMRNRAAYGQKRHIGALDSQEESSLQHRTQSDRGVNYESRTAAVEALDKSHQWRPTTSATGATNMKSDSSPVQLSDAERVKRIDQLVRNMGRREDDSYQPHSDRDRGAANHFYFDPLQTLPSSRVPEHADRDFPPARNDVQEAERLIQMFDRQSAQVRNTISGSTALSQSPPFNHSRAPPPSPNRPRTVSSKNASTLQSQDMSYWTIPKTVASSSSPESLSAASSKTAALLPPQESSVAPFKVFPSSVVPQDSPTHVKPAVREAGKPFSGSGANLRQTFAPQDVTTISTAPAKHTDHKGESAAKKQLTSTSKHSPPKASNTNFIPQSKPIDEQDKETFTKVEDRDIESLDSDDGCKDPPSTKEPLRARLSIFLPQMKQANETLLAEPDKQKEENSFEIVEFADSDSDFESDESDEDMELKSGKKPPHIELNLGLGVLEQQKQLSSGIEADPWQMIHISKK